MRIERMTTEVVIEVSVSWVEDHYEGFIDRGDKNYTTFFSNVTLASIGRLQRLAGEFKQRGLTVYISGNSTSYLGFAIRWCSETAWKV